MRGEVAAWGLIAFGVVYGLWGLHRRRKGKKHTHEHLPPAPPHQHDHDSSGEHTHAHTQPSGPVGITPWVLFVVFVLGPCGPLIPLVMFPAANGSILGLVLVTTVFGTVTIGTMTAVVLATLLGLKRVRMAFARRYMHTMTGGVLALSGLAIQFPGS